MRIIEWPEFLKNGLPGEKPAALTIGVFDGIHLGHRRLIERIIAKRPLLTPVIVTFRENHKLENSGCAIQTFDQKTAILEQSGIETLLVIDFTDSFKRMAGGEFLQILYEHGRLGFLAIGSGFRCGYKLDTDAAAIREFFNCRNVQVEIVPDVLEDGQPISSSRIREAIAGGNMTLAEKMLGYQLKF
jgi:riboflavin kinase/FMN adenylyltransferase